MTMDQPKGPPSPEPERSGGSGDGGPRARGPSSDARERPQRRTFSAAYKARIVEEADACRHPGEIGALLRREGLYSSHLVDWRRQYRSGGKAALQKPRGPAAEEIASREKAKYERQIARLEAHLRQAETIIDVQKKLSQLLASPSAESE